MAEKPNTYSETELKIQYDDMLDEVNDIVRIGSLEYNPSWALRMLDEIAYDCGFSEWLDSEEYDDFEGEYAKRDEIESYHEELEQEKEDAEKGETTND